IANASRARSSFKPPRLAYLGLSVIARSSSASIIWLALRTGTPAASTLPARIHRCALSRLSTIPLRSNIWSARRRERFSFFAFKNVLRKHFEIAMPVIDGYGCDRFFDLSSRELFAGFDAQKGGVGQLLLLAILAGGFSQHITFAFNVQDIIDNLKGEPDGFAISGESPLNRFPFFEND